MVTAAPSLQTDPLPPRTSSSRKSHAAAHHAKRVALQVPPPATTSGAFASTPAPAEPAPAPYRDYSLDEPAVGEDESPDGPQNFPMKLHEILSNPEFENSTLQYRP